jgi:hypothetical protein
MFNHTNFKGLFMNKKLLAVLAGAALVGQAQAVSLGGYPTGAWKLAKALLVPACFARDIDQKEESTLYERAVDGKDYVLREGKVYEAGSEQPLTEWGVDQNKVTDEKAILKAFEAHAQVKDADGVVYFVAQDIKTNKPKTVEKDGTKVVTKKEMKATVEEQGWEALGAYKNAQKEDRYFGDAVKGFFNATGKWYATGAQAVALVGTLAVIKQAVEFGADHMNNDDEEDADDVE